MFFSKSIKRIQYNPDTIFQMIYQQLKGKLSKNCNIRLGDRVYASVTKEEAFKFVRNINTDYIKETNDCDDFSFMAKCECIKEQRKNKFNGYPGLFGMAWTPSHAFNWFINNGAIEFIDNDDTQITQLEEEINLLLL